MRRTGPGGPPPIRVEPDTGWAWCGERRLDLAPKGFTVLRFLVEHPQRLITKDELFTVAWGDTVVSEASLTSCIRDLRRALDDSSRTPRYIETVHRRGFRFIGPVVAGHASSEPPAVAVAAAAPTLVGRDPELARLHALFAAAAGGQRRLVFVTGEPGIGKTTLVESFLAQLADPDALRIGRGQCVEQYGSTEAYLPVLEALGRMGREPRGDALVQVLKQYAPTWLAQLPALLTDEDLESVQRRAQGTTRERMLRELVEAIDALATEAPLVLLLEDLHWSDAGTVELLAMIARRRDPARLLIVGTYRPADVALDAHPLASVTQELGVHGQCENVALDFLSDAAVAEYLERRFPESSLSSDLVRVLHENTGGNPLFLVNVIDDLIARRHLTEADGRWALAVPVERVATEVPQTLWQMIEKQVERLAPDEQAMLAVGSVAGAEFSAALATVDGIDAHAGELCCERLVRRGRFLRARGMAEWPDGTVAGRYGFIHALYRNVLYARVSIGHRVGLHLRVGARLERAHGRHAGDVAGELAMHFEQGRDLERAVHYRTQAAEAALRRHGYRQAVSHATRALELLGTWPPSAERNRQELAVQTVLGAAVIATNGWAAPEVATAYARARDLCAETGITPQLYPVLLGLAGFYLMRGELDIAQDTTQQLLVLADTTDDPAIRLGAHNTTGLALFYRGRFVEALGHFEQARAIYDPERHSPNRLHSFSVDHDPGVSCAAHGAMTMHVLGYSDRGAARMRECLEIARAIDHPLSLAMAYNFAATFHQLRRETGVVRELEDVRLEYATKHDFDLFLLLGEIYRGWLLAEEGRKEEGADRIRQGVAVYQMIGAELGRPTFLGILAEVCSDLDRAEEAEATIAEALALGERTGLRYWDAELHRLQGELVLRAAGKSKSARGAAELAAETSFHQAIEIAQRQEARCLELRAATSLGRLWLRQGKRAEAHTMLSGVYGWFTEGFETQDLIDAKALLA